MISETYGLKILAEDFDKAPGRILHRVGRVTQDSVDTIRDEAKRIVLAGNYAHLPHLHRSFTSDVKIDRVRTRVVGEAGAEHALLQGRLDVYIEFGTPTSGDHPHWRPAGEREIPNWIDALERAASEGFE